MNQNTKVLAIIHARGGSKRVPGKNIKFLNGKPLISYMINACIQAKTVDRVIVSTDHPDIVRISKECGAEVPFIRPAPLSEDVASELVTQHAVKFIEDEEGHEIDVAITIQPTTPFCLPEHIDACVNKLRESNADSVVTVCEIAERPEWMIKEDGSNYQGIIIQGDVGISQTLPKLYLANGAVFATKRSVLLDENLIIGRNNRIVIMPRERSIDIDEPIDFEYAEYIAKAKGF